MSRHPDWRSRFEAITDEIRRRPFVWGAHDCGPAFVGRLVQEMTGADIAAPFRGRYDSSIGALRVMNEAGFADLAELMASLLPEIHPSQARIGDVAAFPVATRFRSVLGVVNGERVFVLRPDGIGTMGLLDAHRAFQVG